MPGQTINFAGGFFLSGVDLESLIADLTQCGFIKRDVSLGLPEDHFIARILHLVRSGTHEATITCQLDEAFHWLQRFGRVVIPYVGMFDSRQEFTGTLFGSRDGENSQCPTMCNLGVDKENGLSCQKWTEQGGIVVVISCAGAMQVELAAEVLEEAGAEGLFGPHLSYLASHLLAS